MYRLKVIVVGVFCLASGSVIALTTPGAQSAAKARQERGWWRVRDGIEASIRKPAAQRMTVAAPTGERHSEANILRDFLEGQRLFDRETFGGNGRTCLTCHSRETGTVSPREARLRFRANPDDPLFLHDGSDDEDGDGLGDERHVTRMLERGTVLMRIRLHPDVSVKDHPEIREVTVPRGIPTTLNTPALDPVLMLDGRQPTLQAQALGAIQDHAQATRVVTARELDLIARFQQTPAFFSSPALAILAYTGQPPELPRGRTASERRGRTFFEDLPPDFSVNPPNLKPGACAACHSGPMLNQTNEFFSLLVPVPKGTRFQTVLVSEFNAARNPVTTFVFRNQPHDLDPSTNRDGTPDGIIEVTSPDPGRALITGRADDFFPFPPGSFDHLNAFKISTLWGVEKTAPYFHDNSAKTLEDVVDHYQEFFRLVSDLDGPGPLEPTLVLSDQDKLDIVAFLKLLR